MIMKLQPQYKVAIFGSARIHEGEELYRDVFTIAKGLAEAGFDVITGGGPGLMQAANAGSQSADSPANSIGLNIRLPKEQDANEFLDIKQEFYSFSSRLDTFMTLSDAVIVAPGGIGTLLELFYTWQLVQVENICETPIILFGSIWTNLLKWLEQEVMAKQLFDKAEMRMLFHVIEPDDVVELIKKIYDDRLEDGNVCTNFMKYRQILDAAKAASQSSFSSCRE